MHSAFNDVPLPWEPGPKFNFLQAGQLYQFVGEEGSGKTQMALLCAKEALKKFPDKHVVWYDCDSTWNFSRVQKQITNLSRIKTISNVQLEYMIKYISKDMENIKVSLIVVDSFSSYSLGLNEFTKPIGIARYISKAMNTLHDKGRSNAKAPVLFTLTTKGQNLYHKHPYGIGSSFCMDGRIHLQRDWKDSWELVDEDGYNLGYRITSTIIKNQYGANDIQKQFWVDQEHGEIFTMDVLERKLFNNR